MAVLRSILRTWPLCLVLLSARAPASAADLTVEEYQLKAAFLFNFAKFVEWPTEVLAAAEPISICVVGNDAFAALLNKTVAGKKVALHDFVVRSTPTPSRDSRCHIAFISNTEHGHQLALLHVLGTPYVLTVGESDDFLADGGVINLTLKESRMRIFVNTEAVARLKIRISSKLLTLAETSK